MSNENKSYSQFFIDMKNCQRRTHSKKSKNINMESDMYKYGEPKKETLITRIKDIINKFKSRKLNEKRYNR